MTEPRTDTILLVCGCEHGAADILDKLYGGGFSVVGPAPTAAMAMAMAAQTAPTIALVAGRPSGRRNAAELAGDLMRTWGVRSWILDHADHQYEPSDAALSADDLRVSHIRRILHGDPQEGRAA